MGEMNSVDLGNQIKENAAASVYVSILGMGLEFNSELTETVTKNKGSNYFCATNMDQLEDIVLKDFDYNFFPAAFDINMNVRCGSLDVKHVFGTPFDTEDRENLTVRWGGANNHQYPETSRLAASRLTYYSHSLRQPLPEPMIGKIIDQLQPPKESITEVNTMFPSRICDDGAMKGGLILVQMEPHDNRSIAGATIELNIEFSDLVGNAGSCTQQLVIEQSADYFCLEDAAIGEGLCKGLLLQQYAQVCRQYCDIANGPDASTAVLVPGIAEAFEAKMEAWKQRAGPEMLQDEKMATVASTFGKFSEMFTGLVDDITKDQVKRAKWNAEAPEREAKIAQERAEWEAKNAQEEHGKEVEAGIRESKTSESHRRMGSRKSVY